MHDVLYFSSLFIGESGTMASECAYFGVPTLYINTLPLMGYLKMEQEHGLLNHFKKSANLIEYLEENLEKINKNDLTLKKSEMMKKNFINTTDFLVWFILDFPKSKIIMKSNPSYQNKFK